MVTLSYPPGPATGRPAVARLMRCRRAETRGHPHGIKGGRGALFGARDTRNRGIYVTEDPGTPGGHMDFFDVVTTQRAMRRLKPDPIPDAALRQIMGAAICAPSGGNRQGWSFLVIRDAAKRARLGELYREAWGELMNVPYYAGGGEGAPGQPHGQDARLGTTPG